MGGSLIRFQGHQVLNGVNFGMLISRMRCTAAISSVVEATTCYNQRAKILICCRTLVGLGSILGLEGLLSHAHDRPTRIDQCLSILSSIQTHHVLPRISISTNYESSINDVGRVLFKVSVNVIVGQQ